LSEGLAQEVKGFNILVAIVEPGVIETPIFSKGQETLVDSFYPHERRLRALFPASLANPVKADVVAQQVKAIIEGDSWKLRYPVGPDAKGMILLRKLTSDEDWIDRYAELDDDAWCERMEREFLGLKLRPLLDSISPATGLEPS